MYSPRARRVLLIVATCLAGASVAAQTAKKPAPAKPAAPVAADRAVPFKVGEVLTYDVSWSTMLTGGSATIAVKERRTVNGRTGYYISADASPRPMLQKLFPFQYRADTLLDVKQLVPIQASTYSDERGRTRLSTTKFPADGTTIDFSIKTATDVHDKRQVPQFSQDPIGVLYFLRWWTSSQAAAIKEGTSIPIPVTNGGDVFYARVQFGAVAQIKCGLGTMPALQIQITVLDEKKQPTGKKCTLWLSADARRLPLRFDAALPVGSFVLTLSGVTP